MSQFRWIYNLQKQIPIVQPSCEESYSRFCPASFFGLKEDDERLSKKMNNVSTELRDKLHHFIVCQPKFEWWALKKTHPVLWFVKMRLSSSVHVHRILYLLNTRRTTLPIALYLYFIVPYRTPGGSCSTPKWDTGKLQHISLHPEGSCDEWWGYIMWYFYVEWCTWASFYFFILCTTLF